MRQLPATPGDGADYARPDVWDRIAALLESGVEPRPSHNCGRVICAPGWSWQPRLLDYDLWLAVKGRGTMRIGAQLFPILPGALFLLRPGDAGHAVQDPNDRLTVVYLHLDFYVPPQGERATLDSAWLPARSVPFQDATQIDALLTRAVRLMESRRRLSEVEARFVVQQALVLIYQQDAANHGSAVGRLDRRVEHIMTYLRSHPEQRLTLEQAAAKVDLAPGYFSRLFTREAGTSFRAFALRTRLERAHFLLEETTMPIGQIAQALDYQDLFLFSRQFKQLYGYAPRQVRRAR